MIFFFFGDKQNISKNISKMDMQTPQMMGMGMPAITGLGMPPMM